MSAFKIEISLKVELSFECRLIVYSRVSWRKAYKNPTRQDCLEEKCCELEYLSEA